MTDEKIERVKKVKEDKPKGNYFVEDKPLQFISSGCTTLDCVLGGGYPLGRVSNNIGDKSSGKTLEAIEICANFNNTFPDGEIRYHEAEAAFDKGYAETLGLPVEKITFVDEDPDVSKNTVEDLFNELQDMTEKLGKSGKPGLYIIDSLDALTDKAEQEREIDAGSFGTGKAKQMSSMFRRLTKDIEKTKIHLHVISQIRDKIGVTFGAKTTRSGGHALDFYASQVIKFAEVEKIKKTIKGVERIIGIWVKAKNTKNKVGLPYRDCEFPIYFGYGINSLESDLNWLKEIKSLSELGIDDKEIRKLSEKHMDDPDRELAQRVAEHVKKCWKEIDSSFMPKAKKY